MWSHAVYNLRIGSDLFWALTPRQYDHLCRRHREDLAHREMVAAFTTAAVINHAFAAPEKAVAPLEFMPNYKAATPAVATPLSPEQQEAKSDFDGKVVALTAELRVYADSGIAGPALQALGYRSKE